MRYSRKKSVYGLVQEARWKTAENPDKLVVTDEYGMRWQLKETLQDVMMTHSCSAWRAMKMFQGVARLVRDGKLDPAALKAEYLGLKMPA